MQHRVAVYSYMVRNILGVCGPSLIAPITEDEVMKWSETALGRLRVLTVFFELLSSTGSRSSGLIKAWEGGSWSDSDRAFLSVLSGD